MKSPIQIQTAIIIVSLAFAVTGCSEDVAAPIGVEEPFSMFGVLNPHAYRQTVLVSPLQPLLTDYGESIDAEVSSTDLSTGERQVWQDSTVHGERGHLDHIFWATFNPRHDTHYRVDVVRSDGATSSATAQVPMDVGYEQIDSGHRVLKVRVLGERFRLLDAELVYIVGFHPFHPAHPVIPLPISYTGKEFPIDGGYEFRFDIGIYYFELAGRYSDETGVVFFKRFPITNGLRLEGLELRITVGGESWDPPGGSFDMHVLVNPGTLRNVENGYGFVGGGYEKTITLCPSQETVADTWFFDYLERVDGECQSVNGN